MARTRVLLRRAVAVAVAGAGFCRLTVPARAQKGPAQPPAYLEFGKPDQAEGKKILDEFRKQGISGDYYLEFTLRVLPRRGSERDLRGRMWGSRNDDGPVSRVEIFKAGKDGADLHLLVQNGPHPAVWRWDGVKGAPARRLGVEALFQPIAGTEVTPFDLQQPFLYWSTFNYEGLIRMHGRPTFQFLLRPPAKLKASHPELAGVRVYLDTQYDALVQAELLGAADRPLQSFSLMDLKKIDNQWLVKSVDVLDETTRNHTRMDFSAAALNLTFPRKVFAAADLAAPAPVPGVLTPF